MSAKTDAFEPCGSCGHWRIEHATDGANMRTCYYQECACRVFVPCDEKKP